MAIEISVSGKSVQIGDIISVFGMFTEHTKVIELTKDSIITPNVVFERTSEPFTILRPTSL